MLQEREILMLTKQLGFFGQDKFIGYIHEKLRELYRNNPEMAKDDRHVLIEYWRTFDNLDLVLEDKLPDYLDWWRRATLPET